MNFCFAKIYCLIVKVSSCCKNGWISFLKVVTTFQSEWVFKEVRILQKYLDGLFVVVFVLFIVSFLDLGGLLNHQAKLGVLLFVIFAIQSNDIGQYLMGRWLGHKLFQRKLAPTISPNKTIEGALFGSILTAIICLPIGRLLTPFNLPQIFGLTWLLTSVGIVGDLLESAIKRRHGVKDMGQWLKGHGGIMDRIDSLLLSVPVFWLIYRLWLI
ncbi:MULTISPECIES: phosphatidate cytidylyltransferase [unclassified Moraxella]|uniref:phosphatidate cytidylyltransferase n=1 Tax=unclassified Moraxella TaxID=2685852 RepID=UPI003AF98168